MSNNKIDSHEMTLMSGIKSSQLKNCIESDNRRRTFTSTKYWIRDNIESAYTHKLEVMDKNEKIKVLEDEIEYLLIFQRAFFGVLFGFICCALYIILSIWLKN